MENKFHELMRLLKENNDKNLKEIGELREQNNKVTEKLIETLDCITNYEISTTLYKEICILVGYDVWKK